MDLHRYILSINFLLFFNMNLAFANPSENNWGFESEISADAGIQPSADIVDQEVVSQVEPSRVQDSTLPSMEDVKSYDFKYISGSDEFHYFLLVCLILLAYCIPMLFYTSSLSNKNVRPARSAANHILISGLVTSPICLLVMERDISNLPFYKQNFNYIFIFVFISLFLIIFITSRKTSIK